MTKPPKVTTPPKAEKPAKVTKPPKVTTPPKAEKPAKPEKPATLTKPAWNDPALTEDQAYGIYKDAGVKKPISESEARAKISKEGWRFNPDNRRWRKPNKPPGTRAPRAPTGPFMRDSLKKVSDPNHELHGLVVEIEDASGNITYDWRRTMRETKTGKIQTGRYPGSEEGVVVQAGHEEAYAGGGTQKYMLEDADWNVTLGGNIIESKGGLSTKVAVEVGCSGRADIASAVGAPGVVPWHRGEGDGNGEAVSATRASIARLARTHEVQTTRSRPPGALAPGMGRARRTSSSSSA